MSSEQVSNETTLALGCFLGSARLFEIPLDILQSIRLIVGECLQFKFDVMSFGVQHLKYSWIFTDFSDLKLFSRSHHSFDWLGWRFSCTCSSLCGFWFSPRFAVVILLIQFLKFAITWKRYAIILQYKNELFDWVSYKFDLFCIS